MQTATSSPSSVVAAFAAEVGLGADFLHSAERLHAPLAAWIAREAAASREGPLVVGLCGPQGSGKSTVVKLLARLLDRAGLRVVVLSIDDLYLPRAARAELAARVHPLLVTRGPPGTHDPELGLDRLTRLATSGPVALPRFDKATDDPEPRSDWPVFEGPADVVLFEGWCVGARPQAPEALARPVNALERDRDPDGVWRAFVNGALAGRYQDLFGRMDRLVQLRPPSFEVVAGWRREQEHALRRRTAESGRPAQALMSDAKVAVFVQHYERLTRHIDTEMPGRADVCAQLGPVREVLDVRWPAPR